jgi:hypothetical protein
MCNKFFPIGLHGVIIIEKQWELMLPKNIAMLYFPPLTPPW